MADFHTLLDMMNQFPSEEYLSFYLATDISTSSEISATSLEDVERYKASYLCSYVIAYDVMIVESSAGVAS